MSEQLNVGVFFGGRSVEHEVSVVTAQQVMAALPTERYRAIPVYVAKSGRWYTGPVLRELDRFRDIEQLIRSATEVAMDPTPASAGELRAVSRGFGRFGARESARVDVAMPLIHGSNGEDGTLQGFFELCDLAYTGSDVAASAVSMDKPLGKAVLRDAGLPVIEHVLVERARWRDEHDAVRAEVGGRLRYPMFVKPAMLGSSIGVSKVDSPDELDAALELAFAYDRRCLVEPAQENAIDVNCSVLGCGSALRTSVCEQPVSTGQLTYADKYLTKGGGKQADTAAGMKGARRLVPAPLDDSLTSALQEASRVAFRAIAAAGVARVDFLVKPDAATFVVNEVNTIPGSLAFYLWEPTGLAFADLLVELVDIALRLHAEKHATTYSIDTWLLRGRPD